MPLLPMSFKELSFSYSPGSGQPILDDISLEIKAGSSMAIVGASGSGKSTIASIILGLHSPSSDPSALTYNGTFSSQINIHHLRSQMAIVSQSPSLFPTSIAANIVYGLPHGSYTMDDIISAATRAGIHDFISSLPLGYRTMIGDSGQGLSGGQAQRVAIARALIRKPKLLILDEATSSLDVESATVIRNTIKQLLHVRHRHQNNQTHLKNNQQEPTNDDDEEEKKKMAVVIITHNKEMMQIADQIVVLDRGRLVEQGTWGQLMGKREGGELRRLVTGGEWQGDDSGGGVGGVGVDGVIGFSGIDWKGKGKGDVVNVC